MVATLDRALAATEHAAPSVRATFEVMQAAARYYRPGDAEIVRQLTRSALRRLDEVDDPGDAAAILAMAGFTSWEPGTEIDQLAVADRLEAVTRGGPDPTARLTAHEWQLIAHLALGHASGCQVAFADMVDVVSTHRLPAASLVRFSWALLNILTIAGDHEAALQGVEGSRRLHARSGLYEADASGLICLEQIAFTSGRLELLTGQLPGAMADDRFGVEQRALAAFVDGDPHRALTILEAAPASAWQRNWTWRGVLSLRAELVLLLADRYPARAHALASDLIELLEPAAGTVANFGTVFQCLGPVDLQLGRLQAQVGLLDLAASSLRSAEATATALGAPVWSARAAHGLAAVIRRTNGPGDADELRARADAVADRFDVRLEPSLG